CAPINTYNGRGVSKPGVIKSDHAIIYSGRKCPDPDPAERPARGEAGMRPAAIRVDPDDKVTKLDPMSRIDFGKVHTVEHNVKVKPFGNVHEGSRIDLERQFDSVWRKDPIARVPQQPSASGPSDISPEALRRWSVALLEKGYTKEEVRARLLTMLHGRPAFADNEDEDDEESAAEEEDAGQDDADVEEEDLYGPG
ncbi:hypothetical protein LTR95_019160, partial [Oleoguttula sp. CCFEE 5521]